MLISKTYLKQIILEEIDKEVSLDKLFSDLDSQIGTKLNSLANSSTPEQQQTTQSVIKKEGFVTAIGIAAAVPKILSLASSAAKYFKFVKTAEQLEKASKYLHRKYLGLIKIVLQKFGGDKYRKASPEKQKLVAELVFMGFVCTLMWYSAYQFGDALASAFTSVGIKTGLLEALLTAIKGGEVVPFLIKNSEQILTT